MSFIKKPCFIDEVMPLTDMKDVFKSKYFGREENIAEKVEFNYLNGKSISEDELYIFENKIHLCTKSKITTNGKRVTFRKLQSALKIDEYIILDFGDNIATKHLPTNDKLLSKNIQKGKFNDIIVSVYSKEISDKILELL